MSTKETEALKFRAGKFVHSIGTYIEKETGRKTPSIDWGTWSHAFKDLELVQTAEREGWGRPLRRHVDGLVWRDTIDPNRTTYRSPLEYMPTDRRWIEYEARKARLEREAQEWQKQQPLPHHHKRDRLAMRVAAPDFVKMLQQTPNRDLHGLTEQSRRIMGDK